MGDGRTDGAADVTIEDALPSDLPAIAAILNQAVRDTTAVWYDAPRTAAQMETWFAERRAAGFPVLVARDAAGAPDLQPDSQDGRHVLGYASYGPFRPHDGYARSVEHSIYVAPEAQGRGIGARLLDALVSRGRAQGLHVMIGGLEAGNAASLALHARAGFVETARMPHVGAKFGRWLTLVFVQKVLDGRAAP